MRCTQLNKNVKAEAAHPAPAFSLSSYHSLPDNSSPLIFQNRHFP